MPDEALPFDHSDLSPEDLEILRTFLATDEFEMRPPDSDEPGAAPELPYPDNALELDDEMLAIFTTEVEEDLEVLRGGLDQVELDERANSPGFHTIQRVVHKIGGTSAAVGCDALSTIAHHIETVIQRVTSGEITVFTGLYGLGHAIGALEMTLESVKTRGQEDMLPLLDLEQDFKTLGISLTAGSEEHNTASGDLRYDRQRFDQFIQHTEQLIEQQSALEHARKQVEADFQELDAAQARLRRIETFFSNMSMMSATPALEETAATPSSSLVARILREATQRTGHTHPLQTKTMPQPIFLEDAARWDELEMDRFSETRLLTYALNEAIADIATATAQLQRALARLDTLIERQILSAQQVRAGALSLCATPFSVLTQHARQAVQEIARDFQRELQFEASGETVEIDQHILEALEAPITQLISTQLVASLHEIESDGAPCQVRLGAYAWGNEIAIELSFSIAMPGGILHMLQERIQPLHGSVTMQSAATGGMTFMLRFPRAAGLVQGLLVRAWEQQVIIPFSQALRVDYQRQDGYDQFYTLNALLGFPNMTPGTSTIQTTSQLQPVLLLSSDSRPASQVAVQVDEVIGQIELLIKPPPAPLRRPGITAMAIDSAGKVLLVLDVPELIRQDRLRQDHTHSVAASHETPDTLQQTENRPPKILIVDDSVSIRRTIRQTLSQKDYTILEARDGLEALEKIEEESPDVLLLDLEMPRMNGYDMLNVLHTRMLLPELKIVLLTSRSSEKHRQRARELGAHAFLTKPCSEKTLLETLESLLV
ncbi:MAG TPA: response regulator [Ktedonobacteraceae bacterium]|nr:response regulator [Ktedonobacteraceae bacterium]